MIYQTKGFEGGDLGSATATANTWLRDHPDIVIHQMMAQPILNYGKYAIVFLYAEPTITQVYPDSVEAIENPDGTFSPPPTMQAGQTLVIPKQVHSMRTNPEIRFILSGDIPQPMIHERWEHTGNEEFKPILHNLDGSED